jgi:hypothetical protein
MALPITFGLDISHHQAASLDLAQCRREGVEFIFIKSTEGAGFVDPAFAANLAEARAAGMLVAAYHYVRSDATAAAQVANVARVVPKDVPVIPDVEANSGGIALVRDFVARLQAAGYHVPLTYLPRWYWQQLGSPSLEGLPSLWSSRYPDTVAGNLAGEYGRAPASYWNGYGGLGVTVLQFTSSARVAGHQPLDGNAYIGTREQLAAVLDQPQQEEDSNVKNLILARVAGGDAIWVGDGITRRHVADMDELTGLQYWIGQKGGDAAVHEGWADLRVLGADIGAAVGQLADDEANVIAAVRAVVTPEVQLKPEDVDRFAQTILEQLPDDIQDAVRQAFARAGQSEGGTGA